jgi:CDP-glycerol glycerophosphotransferase (TagB/SpsB family)
MNKTHLERLADTLNHMSVLVCYASSISIDAAVFNKPVININYEIKKNDVLLRSPTQYYKSEHYSKALKTGGVILADSEEKLVQAIYSYLENPDLQSAERARLVKEQCAFTDGKSGERIAHFLLKQISNIQ